MIEEEIIKQYPSLVARPYMLIKDDLQRKDMQRFWFENTISFLAVLSGAELIKFYKELKRKEDKSDQDLETIKMLQEHKSLTMVGLEHMSLGKWVMMLRETTKVLLDLNVASATSELVEFYHGKNGKNNAKIIDQLVSIRNDDAHGNPIPEDKLNAELDKRQKLIDSLVEELSFLKNYELVLPEKLEIEGSQQFYICKRFIGASIVNTKETFDFSPQLSEVMLINSAKKDARLALSPLLLYLGVQDEENNFLGIFSKYTSKDGTEAKYLNLDGSATIDLVNFGQNQELDLIAQRQSYNEIYADPESFQVNLDISMKLEDDIINIKEESAFSLIIENKKSTDIEDLRVVVDIPKHIDPNIKDLLDNELYHLSLDDGQMVIQFDGFEDNESIVIEPIKFTVTEQGSYTFDGGQAFYNYYRSNADKESGQLTDEDIQFDGVVIEVRDPNSRDKMVPVINISKGFEDVNGESIQNVKIGEDFVFKVDVTNIGFSSAKNVTIDLVFPDNINLKQGKETIKLGQLNPFEERTFKYILNSYTPNIYTISMQNVLYADSQGTRYATRCADDHFVIIRSDLIKEFVYDVRKHIEDLYIDDEEKSNITTMIDSLNAAIDVEAYNIYKEAETEAVIKIIRELVEKISAKKELNVVEKIYEEGKRDSKLTGVDSRKFLVFSSKEMPFFAINLSKGYEPEFFALQTNIDKRFDKVHVKQAVVADGSYTLDHCIDFSDIKYNEQYGKNFFSQWLNIILTRFQKEYLTWKNLTNNITDAYGEKLTYISGQFSAYPYESVESGVKGSGIMTLLDRDNSQSYFVGFDVKPTKNYKDIMKEKMDNNPYIVFLNETMSMKERTRLYNSKNLSYYIHKNDEPRLTRLPSINYNIRDEKSMSMMMKYSEELWNSLCLAHSLDLLDSDALKEQKFLDEMKEFVHKLFDKGFALRQNAKNSDMLDIYPLKYFKPHTATERDCIGFVKKNYTSWQIFLDLFEDDVSDELLEHLSLISSSHVSDKVRWIKSDIQTVEQLNIVTDTILKQAEHYEVSKLAIWPEKLQREMILNHGQTDAGFFIVLKNISAGKNKYSELKDDFKSLSLSKDLDRTLRANEDFSKEAGYTPPLVTVGEGEEAVISIDPMIENAVQKLYEENPAFTYLEEGPALFRIYAKQIAQGYAPLADRVPHPQGVLYKGFNDIKSKYFKKYELSISPQKEQKVSFTLMFIDCKPNIDEKLETVYRSMADKLNIEIEFSRSGTKKQHFKIVYMHQFDNYENELAQMQQLANDLFSAMVENIELIS